MVNLNEKVAIVTGGTKGLGRGIAIALAQAGVNVCVVHREESPLSPLNKGGIKGEIQVFPIQADVTDYSQVEKMVASVISKWGKIDILVNNVGEFLHKSFSDTSIDEWHAIINSNLNSVLYCCKTVIPQMRKQKWGRIINIGVVGADIVKSAKYTSAYKIAKTGVIILTKSIAIEEAKNNITANVILPGQMDNGSLTDDIKESIIKEIPAGRLGTPQDIANAVMFLVSEEANYITGSCITVSGGWMI